MKNEDAEKLFGENNTRLGVFEENDFVGKIGNLHKTLEEANRIEVASSDYSAFRGDIEVIADYNNLKLWNSGLNRDFYFSEWSLSQLCESLKIPTTYISMCLKEGEYDFAAENLNKWLNKKKVDKEYLLRTTNSRLQGFLSNRYGIIDDTHILNVVDSVVGSQGEYVVKNSLITPETMNIRVIKTEQINIGGEDLHLGLNIRNSRVGRSSLEVNLMLFKWICKNGVIFGGGQGELYYKRHIGEINEADFVREFTVQMDSIPDAVKRIKTWVEKAQDHKLDSVAIVEILKQMKKENVSSDKFGVQALELIPKYGHTKFGLVQTITELAQSFSIDTRERYEKYAGRILMAA